MMERCSLLLLASNDVDTLDSGAADEIREINEAIQSATHRDSFERSSHPNVRASDLTKLLLRHNPHILHISGHSRRTGGLVLEDNNGQIEMIPSARLVNLIVNSADDARLKLVFFSFCYSEACADAIAEKVPYAIGVSEQIRADSLLLFSKVFYEALGANKSVQAAFDIARERLKTSEGMVLRVQSGRSAEVPFLSSMGFLKKSGEEAQKRRANEQPFKSLHPEQVNQSSVTTQPMLDRSNAEIPDANESSLLPDVSDAPHLKNQYRIVSSFPISGMGRAFLAEDTHLPSRRRCVIKQFTCSKPEMYQLLLERFEREAVVLERLAESNDQIPDLYTHFSENGQFYLVMEWIKGETVANKVKVNGPFTEPAVKDLLESILHVLGFIHANAKIHRDIKPENIVIRDTDSKPFLIDFGSVKEIVQTVVDPYGNPSTNVSST